MHGTNKARRIERDPSRLQVHEVFHTIQGEGPFVGCPAVFIRFTGCNLRCHFCDTIWDDEGDPFYTPNGLCDVVSMTGEPDKEIAVLTGGEPLRQDLTEFVRGLLDLGWTVQVETAGTTWRDFLGWTGVHTVVSPKLAKVHPRVAEVADAYKYIVGADNGPGLAGSPTQVGGKGGKVLEPPARLKAAGAVYVQPRDDGDPAANAKNTEAAIRLCMEHGYRLCLQTHKIVGLP